MTLTKVVHSPARTGAGSAARSSTHHQSAGAAIVVVIATNGRPDLLRRTLQSIASCHIPDRYKGTLVVENGPKSDVESVVRCFRASPLRVEYLYSSVSNKSRALNLALGTLNDNELVIFTDDDVRVHENWLVSYANASRYVERGFMYGGPFAVDYEVPPPAWLRSFMPPSAIGRSVEKLRPTAAGRVKYNGLNWAAYAADLRAAGCSDEQLGPGTPTIGQEIDLQHRLSKMGVQPSTVVGAMVWHFVPVQRCSAEWVLHRHYRNGFTKGARIRRRVGGPGSFLRFIKLASRSSLTAGCATVRLHAAGGGETQRFGTCVALCLHHGILAGLLGRNRELSTVPWLFRTLQMAQPLSTSATD